MTLIRREVYIINELFAKTLIDINIIKLEEIVLNINKNLTIIKFYNLLRILILIIVKGSRTNIFIINKARYIILAYSLRKVFIKYIILSNNRNLIFKSN